MKKYVYMFPEGNGKMRELLGGKGANLAEMTGLGMPVPQGFTITTEACTRYYEDGKTIYPDIQDQILLYLDQLEKITGKTLGDPEKPLLVSVRSGARASMPGMMDTILNLGISDESVVALAEEFGNERFAWDCYRRFIQMYGEVVEGVPQHLYEDALSSLKAERGVENDTDLDANDLKGLVASFKEISNEHLGGEWTSDPREQLNRAVNAVFRSWGNPRAEVYRRANNISASLGTAVNIMQMVFGNRGDTSATGVCFTRNPSTGEKALYGEFLVNAQGEDVVAGIRTPRPLAEMREVLPEAYDQLIDTMHRMENHYKDMQDMEFTVEDGKLFLLQTRNGKRTAAAALKVASDLVDEGIITKDEALLRIAALYKIEDAIRGSDPDHRRAVRQELSRPLADEFFTWLKAQAARVSRIVRRRFHIDRDCSVGLDRLQGKLRVGFVGLRFGSDSPEAYGLGKVEELFDEVASEEDIATEEQKLTKGQIFVKYVLMNKVIWLLCFANIFLYVVRIGIDQWSTVYAHQELGFSKEVAIQGFTFFEVGALVGTLMWGYLSDLANGRRGLVACVALALIIATLGLYQHATTQFMFLGSLFLLGFLVFGPQLLIGEIGRAHV